MTVLEQKVDALAELAMAETRFEKKQAMKKLKQLMGAPLDADTVEQDAEAVIKKLMLELGCKDNLLGYDYAVQAICMAVDDPNTIHNIMAMVYTPIAERFDTTVARVERAIRHLIDVAWIRGDQSKLEKYFGNTVNPNKGKPTNGEFLARMANIVREKMKAEVKR